MPKKDKDHKRSKSNKNKKQVSKKMERPPLDEPQAPQTDDIIPALSNPSSPETSTKKNRKRHLKSKSILLRTQTPFPPGKKRKCFCMIKLYRKVTKYKIVTLDNKQAINCNLYLGVLMVLAGLLSILNLSGT